MHLLGFLRGIFSEYLSYYLSLVVVYRIVCIVKQQQPFSVLFIPCCTVLPSLHLKNSWARLLQGSFVRDFVPATNIN